jgi:hypothetical protein
VTLHLASLRHTDAKVIDPQASSGSDVSRRGFSFAARMGVKQPRWPISRRTLHVNAYAHVIADGLRSLGKVALSILTDREAVFYAILL